MIIGSNDVIGLYEHANLGIAFAFNWKDSSLHERGFEIQLQKIKSFTCIVEI